MYERDMARVGRHFYRLRKANFYIVMLAGAAFIALSSDARLELTGIGIFYNAFWLVVILLGAAIRVVTSGYAPTGTSGSSKAEAIAESLNTTGLYSIVRNPLYVGRVLTFTGLAFLTGYWQFGVMVFLFMYLVYERIIAFEEVFLTDTFGQAYLDWAAQVPALWPRFSLWVKSERAFWFKRAFRREVNKFFLMSLTLMLFASVATIKAMAVQDAQIYNDLAGMMVEVAVGNPVTLAFFAVCTFIRFIGFLLKNFTHVMDGIV